MYKVLSKLMPSLFSIILLIVELRSKVSESSEQEDQAACDQQPSPTFRTAVN